MYVRLERAESLESRSMIKQYKPTFVYSYEVEFVGV